MQREIEELRARATGSTSSRSIFEILDYEQMNEVAAYGGFPTRYPHWRFGMEYEQLAKSYEYGLSKIYEMVINNNPSYAYLLEGNSLVDQKLVMAHVYGHVDFFKNNYCFSQDQPQDDGRDGQPRHARAPPHRAAGHREGRELHRPCLSLENLIDPMSPFIARQAPTRAREDEEPTSRRQEVPRLRAKAYMDTFINPPEFLEEQTQEDGAGAGQAARSIPGASPSATCCCSCSSTRRSSTGSATSSRSSATRPTTSRRRGRPRS